ncbi:MAG: hypothetical protein E7406_00105 [Ruminococcaceae bacterium]|nr:hypothetical protein [Oscillospiraceae bacterium]
MLLYKKCYFLFLIGGLGYPIIELLWRGYTHPSMGILGGFCLIAIWLINEICKERAIWFRAILCSATITGLELLTGILVNIVLKLNVWNYSDRFLNIMGQICPLFSLLWFCLSYTLIFLIERFPFFNFHTKKERG